MYSGFATNIMHTILSQHNQINSCILWPLLLVKANDAFLKWANTSGVFDTLHYYKAGLEVPPGCDDAPNLQPTLRTGMSLENMYLLTVMYLYTGDHTYSGSGVPPLPCHLLQLITIVLRS